MWGVYSLLWDTVYNEQDIQDLSTCFSFQNIAPQSCYPEVFYRFIYEQQDKGTH